MYEIMWRNEEDGALRRVIASSEETAINLVGILSGSGQGDIEWGPVRVGRHAAFDPRECMSPEQSRRVQEQLHDFGHA